MIRKIVALCFVCTLFVHSLSAQEKRNYRRERAELARQEKEEKRQRKVKEAIDYGTNILSVLPISALDLGVGVGLSYEKIVGPDKNVGIVLPFHVIFQRDNDFSNYSNYYGGSSNSKTYVYFTPGIKIYPFGQRKVNFAIGPNLLLGTGGGKEWRSDINGNYNEYDVSKFRFGMLLNSYLNIQITKSFYTGAQIGLGILYIDREKATMPGLSNQSTNNGMNVTGEFTVSLGYRF